MIRCFAAFLFLFQMFTAYAVAQNRLAFIIGNDTYQNVPALQKAGNDAAAVAKAVEKIGFKVTMHQNLDRRAMSRAMTAFEQTISKGDEVFLFFAGHGFELRGINYLLPIDVPKAGPGQESEVIDASFDAANVIDRLRNRGAQLTIAVLDACRDNPFAAEGTRSIPGTRGLAQMTAVEGVFILMSAGAKQMALDRLSERDNNPNSLFTRFFVEEIATPDQTLVQIAKKTQINVRRLAATIGFEQTPAYYDQVIGDVILARMPVQGNPAAQPASPTPVTPSSDRPTITPTVTTTAPLQVSPNVRVGGGVTFGPGVIINGKPAEMMLKDAQRQMDQPAIDAQAQARQNAGQAASPGSPPAQIAALMPQMKPEAPAVGQLDRAPVAGFTRSNQGWIVSISTPDPATEIFYRIEGQGNFTSTGLADFLDQRTRQRMPNPNFQLPPRQKAAVLEVKYNDSNGQEVGPFKISFDPDTALFNSQKQILDGLWPSWVAFRDFHGRKIYFSTLITYRCAIADVFYGLNGADPLKRYALPPCNANDPFSIPSGAKIWMDVLDNTDSISLKIVWRDGTSSPVRTIER
jgi:hypothetical protein